MVSGQLSDLIRSMLLRIHSVLSSTDLYYPTPSQVLTRHTVSYLLNAVCHSLVVFGADVGCAGTSSSRMKDAEQDALEWFALRRLLLSPSALVSALVVTPCLVLAWHVVLRVCYAITDLAYSATCLLRHVLY